MVRAFAAIGLPCVLIEQTEPGAGASGFPASLVTPRFDVGDAGVAALYAQALSRARTLYAATPGAVLAEGVLQLEQTPRDGVRFGKVAAQDVWPEAAMTPLDPADCAARLGEPVASGGLFMRDALAIRPRAVLDAWLGTVDRRFARVAAIEPGSAGWRLTDGAGETIVEADVVVVAAGWGAAALRPDLPLSAVRGQADWVEGVQGAAVAWGGYAAPTADGLLFGATHDRGVTAPLEADAASSDRNLQTLAARLPGLAARVAGAGAGVRRSRVAIRAVTPDRLPLAGALAPGLFTLTGLGSRGFCVAPLLAEHVAAVATGAPSPLPVGLEARVDPQRFVIAGDLAQPLQE